MTNRTAATRYARALFDVVLKEGNPERVDEELSAFAALVAGNDALRRVLANPAIPAARKRAVMVALIDQAGAQAWALTPALGKLLLMLAERDRLVLLPELAEAYRDRLMQHQQVLRAELVTAVPLPDDRRATIERGLSRATGGRVMLTARVDPAIIGGAVTRVGSTVYDGSVVGQLQRLKEQLQTS